MPAPIDTLWDLEPHSVGKHAILRRYIEAWLPIMAKYNPRLIVVDGFAGPGEYSGGEPGSPVILLDAFLNHAARAVMNCEIVYVFIEERADRVAHLRSLVDRRTLPANVRVELIEDRYQDVFQARLEAIRAAGMRLAPTFAFVDPFGYSQAPMDLTGKFLQFPRCEVLVYMPLPFVARFVGRAGQDAALTSLFGTDRWRDAIPLQGEERADYLHNLFLDQLHKQGCSWVRSFEIDADGSRGYHLFFGTSHELGLEKMKEAMWAADPVSGQRYSDSTDPRQTVLFANEVDTTPLLASLRERFGSGVFTIEAAERLTILETPYIKSHLRRKTLVPAETAGLLEAVTSRGRARTYPPGVQLRFRHPKS